MSDCFRCEYHEYYFKKNGVCPIEVSECKKDRMRFTIARLGNFYPNNCSDFLAIKEEVKEVGCEFCEASLINSPCENCGFIYKDIE